MNRDRLVFTGNGVIRCLCWICLLMVSIHGARGEEQAIEFDIPRSSADNALNLFARQANIQLLYPYDVVKNIRVRGLSGRYLVSDGVAHLLRETCLEAVFSGNDNNKGITIVKIKKCQKKNLVASVSTAILSILGASNGFAQEGGTVPQAKTSIEEIVVTARRQSESLQTTPVAVTALTETMLQVKQIETIESVQYSTPNLNISTNSPNSSGFAFLAIRGQSNLGGGASNDPAIGVYVDGVYIARPGGSLLDLIDTRQVEVLRGPQGTLFGRNTTGGALNISSNEPVHNLEGSVQATLGNHGLRQVTGVVNVPLIQDELAARLVYRTSEHDGYGDNVFLRRELNDDDRDFYRLSVKYEPKEGDWDLLLTADRTDQEDNGQLQVVRGYNAANAALANLVRNNAPDENGPGSADDNLDPYIHPGSDWYDGFASENEYSELTSEGLSATLNVDLGWSQLKSITAWRSLESNGLNDLDALPYLILNSNYVNDQSQFSQELQLSGGSGALNWIGGLFYFEEEGDELTRSQTMFSGGGVNRNDGTAENTSYAAYGQLYYDLTNKLRLSAGLRYTEDQRDVVLRNKVNEGLNVCALPASDRDDGVTCQQSLSVDYDYTSYLFGLDYQMSENVFFYGKTSRAFLAGGWNLRNGSAPSFEPEEVNDIEFGAKLDWLDSRVRTNFAVFYAEQSDVQRSATGITNTGQATSFIRNAAEATVKGVEFELVAVLWDGMEASFVLGTLDAEYDEFIDSTGLDRSNETPPQSPEYNYSVSLTQNIPVSYGEWVLHADYAYVDDFVIWQGTAPSAAAEALFARGRALSNIDGYGLLNARLALNLGANIELSLWGRNLTDEEYFSRTQADFLTSFGYAGAYPGDPRTYGATVTYRFAK